MPQSVRNFSRSLAVCLILATGAIGSPQQFAYDAPPINYSRSKPTDRIADLDGRLSNGRARLAFDDAHGYLAAVLKELDIPVSSQSLVFSKTSFQRQWINPKSPRALYFNDDVYIGWVRGGEVVEVASQDPQLGTVFYTLSQDVERQARFLRQTDNCLQCHDSTGLTLGVPGVTVRSIYPGADGQPRFNLGGFRTTWRSPLEERWGGWYVTGEHGELRHMGNIFVPDEPNPDMKPLRDRGANLTDLGKRIDTEPYLTDTSDIVALMVLETQTAIHNLITRANHETRTALSQNDEINRSLGVPLRPLTEGSRKRVEYACEPLVEGLFYTEEAALGQPIHGNSSFAADFEKRGPFDGKGRSLRQFDLTRRMFKYPLSYLIYSKSFLGLPPEAQDYIGRRVRTILDGGEKKPAFRHLTPELRKDIREILLETHPLLAQALK
jgi:hypothetical protein